MNETFKTQREFNNKFPTKFYKCPKCGRLTTDCYFCTNCQNQANNFIYADQNYQYTILETGITEEIFTPIELFKEGVKNDKEKS